MNVNVLRSALLRGKLAAECKVQQVVVPTVRAAVALQIDMKAKCQQC